MVFQHDRQGVSRVLYGEYSRVYIAGAGVRRHFNRGMAGVDHGDKCRGYFVHYQAQGRGVGLVRVYNGVYRGHVLVDVKQRAQI